MKSSDLWDLEGWVAEGQAVAVPPGFYSLFPLPAHALASLLFPFFPDWATPCALGAGTLSESYPPASATLLLNIGGVSDVLSLVSWAFWEWELCGIVGRESHGRS